MMNRHRLRVMLLCAALLLACALPARAQDGTSEGLPPPKESVLRKDLKDASVVLIVLNSLAPSHLHCYGYDRETSPNIDALAAESVRFTRCYAQTPTDFSSNAVILTGLDPISTRLFGPYKVGMQLAEEYYTFAEMMGDAGYFTAGFISSLEASKSVRLDQGIVHLREFFRESARAGPADADREIREWFLKARNQKFFAFIQIEPPDAPYLPPPPYLGKFTGNTPPSPAAADIPGRDSHLLTSEVSEKVYDPTQAASLRDAYDENVAYADYRVGLYLNRMRETGILDRSIVIVTSNHGEAFAQHGPIRHDTTVFEEMIRVPLIVRFPGAASPRGQVVDRVVELLDLMPTVADAVGFSIKVEKNRRSFGHEVVGEGASWLPILWGGRSKDDGVAYSMSFMGSRTVIEERWKYILNPEKKKQALYDLEADPNETISVIADHPEEVKRLKALWTTVFGRRVLPVQPVMGEKVDNPKKTLKSIRDAKSGNNRDR